MADSSREIRELASQGDAAMLGPGWEAIGNLGRSWYLSAQERAREAEVARGLKAARLLQNEDKQAAFRVERDPGSLVRELRAEVDGMKPKENQTFLNWLGMPPGYHLKTPERNEEDQKRAVYIRGLLSGFGYPQGGKAPPRWSLLPKEVQGDMLRYATDDGGFRKDTDSPYEYHGFLGKGSPLHTLITWGQGPPGMVMALGEMGAKAVDPVSAPEKNPQQRFMHALNTFTAPGQQMADWLGYANPVPADHSAWSAQDATQKKYDRDIRYDTPDPDSWRAERDAQVADADVQMLGRDYIGNRFAQSPWAAQAVGPEARQWIEVLGGSAIDDLLNPLLDVPGIRAAAMAKRSKLAKTAYQLGQELAPGMVLNSLNGSLQQLGAARSSEVR